jgi:hypothetical protein
VRSSTLQLSHSSGAQCQTQDVPPHTVPTPPQPGLIANAVVGHIQCLKSRHAGPADEAGVGDAVILELKGVEAVEGAERVVAVVADVARVEWKPGECTAVPRSPMGLWLRSSATARFIRPIGSRATPPRAGPRPRQGED